MGTPSAKYGPILVKLGPLVVAGLVAVNAVAVAYVALENRHAFSRLADLRASQQQMEGRWSQLALERSALLSPINIESKAIVDMGMSRPTVSDRVVFQ